MGSENNLKQCATYSYSTRRDATAIGMLFLSLSGKPGNMLQSEPVSIKPIYLCRLAQLCLTHSL